MLPGGNTEDLTELNQPQYWIKNHTEAKCILSLTSTFQHKYFAAATLCDISVMHF